MTRHELRRHFYFNTTPTGRLLSAQSISSTFHIHIRHCVFFVPLVYSALRPFPSPHHCIITSNFSHSYGFTLSFRPRLLLGPRLPLHEGERSELFSSKVQPSDFRAFLFLTARVLHRFGVLADVLLPLTPPSSVMNQMRFHFDFFARHWALSVCRWSVIRSWRWGIWFFCALSPEV